MTNLSTPCAAGCWGPKFIVRLVTVLPGTGSVRTIVQTAEKEGAGQGGNGGKRAGMIFYAPEFNSPSYIQSNYSESVIMAAVHSVEARSNHKDSYSP